MLRGLGLLSICLLFLATPADAQSRFVRGDVDGVAGLSLQDGIVVLNVALMAQPSPCVAANDVNGDGQIDVADATYAFTYLFLGGPPPPKPFPDCGDEPSPGGLGCLSPTPSSCWCPRFEFVSEPVRLASVDVPYSYSVRGYDPLGETVAYDLNAAPTGATLGGGGQLEWTPSAGQVGTHPVEIQVTTACGEVSVQSFSITVFPGEVPEFSLHGQLVPSGDGPVRVAVADYDRDGFPDAAVANLLGENVTILVGTGDSLRASHAISLPDQPASIVASDFNADGKEDLVLCFDDDVQVAVLLGNGDATFQPPVLQSESIVGGRWLDHADYDGDGNRDLLVVGSSAVEAWLGDGAGSFSLGGTFTVPGSVASASADIDLDGDIDVVVVRRLLAANAMAVYWGNGSGSFVAGPEYALNDEPEAVLIFDANVDGLPDVLVSPVREPRVVLFESAGGGVFDSNEIPMPYRVRSAEVADLNGDAIPDLITGAASRLGVSFGIGDGTYQDPVMYAGVGNVVNDLDVRDFDQDGELDVLTMTKNQDSCTVLFGVGGGQLGGPDLIQVCDGPSWLTFSDFDGDDVQDLVAGCVGSDEVVIADGVGDGRFGPSRVIRSGFLQIASLRSGDFDGDGNSDVLVLDSGSDTATTLRGLGNGDFSSDDLVVATPGVSNYRDLELVDWNSDTVLDFIVVNNTTASLDLFAGAPDGSFALSHSIPLVGDPSSSTAADLNRDGVMDFVAVTAPFGPFYRLEVFLGHAVRGPQSVFVRSLVREPIHLHARDLNGDGILDLVGPAGGFTMFVLPGLGDGTFDYSTFPIPAAGDSDVRDLNGDGHLDVVLSSYSQVLVYIANGDGTYREPQRYLSSVSSHEFEFVDLDNDGDLDLAAGSYLSEFVQIWRSRLFP